LCKEWRTSVHVFLQKPLSLHMGKKGGKKGGKSPKKEKGPKEDKPAVLYVDHAKWVRPETPPPKDYELPTEVKLAALEGNTQRVLRWLDEDNGHVDAQWFRSIAWMQPAAAHQGFTLLMCAASSRAEKLVTLLLDEGASIDMQDAAGDTALMHAARARLRGYGNHDATDRIVLTLMERGSSLTLNNRRGESVSTMINSQFVVSRPRSADAKPEVPIRLLTGGGSRPLSASAAYLSPRMQESKMSTLSTAGGVHTAQRYLDRQGYLARGGLK
jgi:hypothetical protein